jgi:Zn-dependent protease with chaperone function
VATDQPVGPPVVDFFERQHAARGTTFKLVGLFLVAIVAIVVSIDLVILVVARNQSTSFLIGCLAFASAASLLIIAGGTLSKLASLRAGGAAIALSLGAVPVDPGTRDPQLRRFVNIVEEMSIASGVPMPRLFVLAQEPGINAFAAGYGPSDAAVTVTGGALQQLNRDELQGVIGHEFSHILNGDMRMNVRLIGLVAGLLVLGLVGLRILAFGGGGRGKKDSAGSIIVVFGIAALVLGFVGQFFAGLIKAAVSRQREWLADASSIQFTRQTTGLSGALKKIAGVPAGSTITNSANERQINHMLFGEGKRSFSQVWATHPPLVARIQALEPGFSAEEIPALERKYKAHPPVGLAEDQQLGLTGPEAALHRPPAAPPVTAPPTATASGPATVDPQDVARRVGTFSTEDLDRGAAISSKLAPHIRDLASHPSTSMPLVLALLLDPDAGVHARQHEVITGQLGSVVAAATEHLFPEVAGLDPLLRIPLVGIALPALGAGPRDQVEVLVRTVDSLISADGTFTLFEYCLARLISSNLRDTLNPQWRSRIQRSSVAQVQDAAYSLLAVIAAAGNRDRGAAEHAFQAGVGRLGLPPRPFAPPANAFAVLDSGWDQLDSLAPLPKRSMIEALVAAVTDDGVLEVAEAELLRTACALLHCPVPALVA